MKNIQNSIKQTQEQKKSSKLVYDFLEKTKLHKKEFAQMIGVTLSYVYNLIDENVPFSTRSITLERIATVMDINPEEFIEYQIPSDVEIMRVYTMHDADRHQDHLAVYQASMVACRTIPQILGYETPSTWLSFMPQVFESVKEEYFTVKLAALKKHKSQERRDYMRHDRLRAVAQFRGQQVNSDLGEGFVIHKMIL